MPVPSPERQRFFAHKSDLRLVALMGVLLVVVAIFALAWLPYRREHRVTQAIEQFGGTVERKLVAPNWIRAVVGDDWLHRLKVFDRAVEVSLTDTPATNSDAAALGELNELEVVYLNGTHVGDSALIHLRSLPKLRVLFLSRTMVTDAGVCELSRISSLEELSLYGTKVGDPAIDGLKLLTHLEWLDLRATQVTDAGLDVLKSALPGCQIQPDFQY